MKLVDRISNANNRLREQHDARQQRHELEQQLAAYQSAADRQELDAILSRHSPEMTREIDEILTMQAVVRQQQASPAFSLGMSSLAPAA